MIFGLVSKKQVESLESRVKALEDALVSMRLDQKNAEAMEHPTIMAPNHGERWGAKTTRA